MGSDACEQHRPTSNIACRRPRRGDDSTLFATTERDGWSHLGDSTLWYKHEVSGPGWVKFWIDSSALDTFRLAAFSSSVENSARKFVMASRRYTGQGDHVVDVVASVDEGMQVLLWVANIAKHQREGFTLHWEATDAPNWHTNVGRLSFGRRDGVGYISRIRQPRDFDQRRWFRSVRNCGGRAACLPKRIGSGGVVARPSSRVLSCG